MGTGQTAPWVAALAVNPDDLGSIPGTYMVEEDTVAIMNKIYALKTMA